MIPNNARKTQFLKKNIQRGIRFQVKRWKTLSISEKDEWNENVSKQKLNSTTIIDLNNKFPSLSVEGKNHEWKIMLSRTMVNQDSE